MTDLTIDPRQGAGQQRTPPLFILARSFTQASEFARQRRLMPGWKYVMRPEVVRGTDHLHIVELPGWQHRLGQEALAEITYRREVVFLDPEADDIFAPWRRS